MNKNIAAAAGTEPKALRLIDTVRPGCRVTIVTPRGQQRSGRAVMRSSYGGWVLNGGGAHGTPVLADDTNTVKVSFPRS